MRWASLCSCRCALGRTRLCHETFAVPKTRTQTPRRRQTCPFPTHRGTRKHPRAHTGAYTYAAHPQARAAARPRTAAHTDTHLLHGTHTKGGRHAQNHERTRTQTGVQRSTLTTGTHTRPPPPSPLSWQEGSSVRPGPTDAQKAQEPQTTRAPAAHIQVAAAWLPHRHVVSPSPVSSGEEKQMGSIPPSPFPRLVWATQRGIPPPRAAGFSVPIGHRLLGCRSAAAGSKPPARTRLHTGSELPAGLPALTLKRAAPRFPRPTTAHVAATRGGAGSSARAGDADPCRGGGGAFPALASHAAAAWGRALQAAAPQKPWDILRYLTALSNSSEFTSPKQHVAILQRKPCVRPAPSCSEPLPGVDAALRPQRGT